MPLNLNLTRRSFVCGLGLSIAGLAGCGSSGSSSAGSSAASTSAASGSQEGVLTTASGEYASGTHHATIEVADYGTIKLELDADTAPITVANFAKLANEGFYDGLTFHRIIEGFMIQGGDPNGNGTGGSSENIKGEFSENGVENNISHERGVISMARSSAYDSASSQFFIMQEDGTYLDGQYAAFGRVTEGMEVVDAIAEAAKPTDSNGTIASADQPVITSIAMED